MLFIRASLYIIFKGFKVKLVPSQWHHVNTMWTKIFSNRSPLQMTKKRKRMWMWVFGVPANLGPQSSCLFCPAGEPVMSWSINFLFNLMFSNARIKDILMFLKHNIPSLQEFSCMSSVELSCLLQKSRETEHHRLTAANKGMSHGIYGKWW